MEIRFMPSFARDVNQYGFILNISSEQAHRLVKFDINTDAFSIKVKQKFGLHNLSGNGNKNGVSNYIERASYVILGLNKRFIEGVIVGRKVENDKIKLKLLKEKFPNCYIYNLELNAIGV